MKVYLHKEFDDGHFLHKITDSFSPGEGWIAQPGFFQKYVTNIWHKDYDKYGHYALHIVEEWELA